MTPVQQQARHLVETEARDQVARWIAHMVTYQLEYCLFHLGPFPTDDGKMMYGGFVVQLFEEKGYNVVQFGSSTLGQDANNPSIMYIHITLLVRGPKGRAIIL